MTSDDNAQKTKTIRNVRYLVAACILLTAANPASGSEIHELVQCGDVEPVRTALRLHPEKIDVKDEGGRTPLHWACRSDQLEMVELLVGSGAAVDVQDQYLNAPLHSLASRNLSDGMVFLIERGADVDVVNYERMTPLHLAAESGSNAAARVLIAAGADLEIKNDRGRTALILCARERGDASTARVLLEAGANVNAVDASKNSALDLAAWRGKTEMVSLLLDAGAKVPTDQQRAQRLFSESASNGLTRLFTTLVDAGGDPAFPLPGGGSLLHEAAAGGSLEILRGLASHGLDIDQQDRYGWTPLHYAARDGRIECATWLISNGAKTGTRNTMGETPFNVADQMKMNTVAEVLREAGADTSPARFPDLRGPYLGQEEPGDTPQPFAVGVVSSIWSLHSAVSFSPEGDLAMWAPMVEIPGEIYSQGGVMVSRRVDGRWTAPDWADFSGEVDGDVPFIAPDGRRVFFISTRSLDGRSAPSRERIWYADRRGDGWTSARAVDPVVNDLPQHWQFSVDSRQDLFVSMDLPAGQGGGDIYRSQLVSGSWQKPVNLGPPVNTEKDEATPYIAPDESYLVFQRDGDLFVSLRSDGGGWSEPKDIGAAINTEFRELCPLVSPDGKFLFFLRYRDGVTHAWWVRTESFLSQVHGDHVTSEPSTNPGEDEHP
jgi:ankyrin repeat protein